MRYERSNGSGSSGVKERMTKATAPFTPVSVLLSVLLLPSTLVMVVPFVILQTGFGYRVPDENVCLCVFV